MDTPISEALIEPVRPVSLGFQALLGMANAGAVVSLMPVLVVLIPAQVTKINPTDSAASLAFVLSTGAAGALIGNPLAGALSDRTTSRFGRRRPWLFTGMIGTIFGLGILANSNTILLLAVGWTLVQFFGNVLLSAYNAILPDRVPVAQRGTTQAIIGLSAPVAIILSDLLFTQVADVRSAYYPVAAVLAALTITFILLYQEAKLPEGILPPFRLGPFLASFWIKPGSHPGFAGVWVMWLLAWSGYNLGTGGFFFLYVQNITRYASLFPGHPVSEGMAVVQMLQIAVGVPIMLAAGVLSDRVRRRKGFVVTGIMLIAAGTALLVFFSTWPMVLAASITIGAGFWIFYNLGLAMISQMLPSAASRGKDLGVINVAACLPQILIPPLGAAVIHAVGESNPASYQILFAAATAAAGLAVWFMHSIRER